MVLSFFVIFFRSERERERERERKRERERERREMREKKRLSVGGGSGKIDSRENSERVCERERANGE